MLSRKAVGPLVAQVPGPAQDRPSWRRVGIIAAVGFVVGIAWPRLAGVRLGPSLPDVPSAAVPASSSAAQAPPTTAPASAAPSASSIGSPAVVGDRPLAASSPPGASPIVAPGAATARGNGRTSPAGASAVARSGPDSESTAQVVWEGALVRDAPAKTGKVVARLARGTTVRLGASKDGWYPVRYGDGFAGDGWLYRGAIGR